MLTPAVALRQAQNLYGFVLNGHKTRTFCSRKTTRPLTGKRWLSKFRVLAALLEDPNSIPCSYVRLYTAALGDVTPSWLPWALRHLWRTLIHRDS